MRRSQLSLPFVTLALVAAGCRTRPAAGLTGLDCDPQSAVCVPRDAGSPSVDGSDSAGDGGGVTIEITKPVSPVYTNGSRTIQVAFSPASAAPSSADLFDGDTELATVSAPFTFVWDTSALPAVPEGLHQITARATVAGKELSSDPVSIFVDRTAPGIANRSPSADATNVLFSDPIQILFSEAIDPATLAGAITLSTGVGQIATSATLAADGKTVDILLPDRRAVALPADVTVAIKATIADLAGNPLGPVAPWSWNAPLWVKLPMLSGKYPEIALGADDGPLVLNAVEQGAIGSNDLILQFARLMPSRVWDTSVSPPQGARPASRVSSDAALAVGADGLPVIAWPESQGSTPDTMHVAKWTGTAWDKSYGRAVAGGTNTYNPALAFSPSGDLFLAWEEPNPTAFAVFAAKWTGTAWDTSYANVGVIGAANPVLKFGAGGAPLVSFCTFSACQVARWAGTAWTLLPTYNSSQEQSLAIDAMDRPVVLSWSGQATDQYLRLFFLNQGAWVEEIPAISANLQPHDAELLIPADGHPIVVWTEYDTNAGSRVVRVARHTGAQWDFAYGSLDGVTGRNTDGAAPRLLLDGSGSPIVAWQETDGIAVSTYVWRSNH